MCQCSFKLQKYLNILLVSSKVASMQQGFATERAQKDALEAKLQCCLSELAAKVRKLGHVSVTTVNPDIFIHKNFPMLSFQHHSYAQYSYE